MYMYYTFNIYLRLTFTVSSLQKKKSVLK